MFDFLNSGKLEKLTIESWSKIDRPGKAEKVFTAYINPDEFTIIILYSRIPMLHWAVSVPSVSFYGCRHWKCR